MQSGQDKIQKICDNLRLQTIEPAKQEAKEILENAHIEAESIKNKAKEEVKNLISQAAKEIEKQKQLLGNSLKMAARQTIDVLKQEVEKKFFSENLFALIEKSMADPKIIADLINAIVHALGKEGTDADFAVYIAKAVDPKAISELLAKDVFSKIKQGPIQGDFLGGAKIVLKDKKITFDVSEKELKDLISEYIRKDFRRLIFEL